MESLRRTLGPLAVVVLAACSSESPIRIVRVDPPVAWREGNDRITLTLAQAAGAASQLAVTFERIRDLEGRPVPAEPPVGGVDPLPADAPEKVAVFVQFPQTSAPGVYRARLRWPDGHHASLDEALVLLPDMTVAGPASDGACLTGPSPSLAIEGTDLAVVDGAGPRVHIGANAPFPGDVSTDVPVMAAAGECREVPFAPAHVQLCSRVEAMLPSSVPGGVYEVSVAVPRPPLPQFSVLLDAPVTAQLLALFSTADAALDLPVGGGDPTLPGRLQLVQVGSSSASANVTLDGQPLPATMTGCRATGLREYQQCDGFHVELPRGQSPGRHEIAYAAPTGCRSTFAVQIAQTPVIQAITPSVACEYDTFAVRITGSGFQVPQVLLDGAPLLTLGGCPVLTTYDFPPCTDIDVAVGPKLDRGVRTVTVVDASSPPISSAPLPLTVAPGPATFRDPRPRHFYNGLAHEVSIRGQGFTTAPLATTITRVDGTAEVPVAVAFASTLDAVTISVPAAVASGDWQFSLVDDTPCTGSPSSAMTLHDDPVAVRDTFQTVDWWNVATGSYLLKPLLDASAGNPGGAATWSTDGAGPDWYFVWHYDFPDGDLAALRFDLRATGSGAPVSGADVILRAVGYQLEYDLAARPGATWASWLVPLDDAAGWMRRDAFGTTTRPATADDLALAIAHPAVSIRGRWTDGAGEAAIDNVQLELHH